MGLVDQVVSLEVSSFMLTSLLAVALRAPGFCRESVDVAIVGSGGEGELQAGFGIHLAGGRSFFEFSLATRLDFHLDLAFINDFYIGVEGEGQDFAGVCLEGQGTWFYGRYAAYGEDFVL